MLVLSLIVTCINGASAKTFQQWLIDDGNENTSIRGAVVTIPTNDTNYVDNVLNQAFRQDWITSAQLAHASTNFHNALRNSK